jgi:glutamate/tyrosine decarboxylase-like PLP-dependent enzyme
MSLDFDHGEFRRLLHQAADTVADIYESPDQAHVFEPRHPDSMRRLFDEELPRRPGDASDLIERFRSEVIPTSTLAINPNFYGYVISAGNQMGVVSALLHAGANICNAKWDLSSGAAEIERTVIRWIAEFIGCSPNTGGVLTTGGTMANLTCLHVARKIKANPDAPPADQLDPSRMKFYASNEVHSSVESSLDMMGMSSNQLRCIGTHADFRIDCDALEDQILSDIEAGHLPLCIVGSAGSTNTGAVDDLDRLASLASEYGLWFHVDAAYGGPAAGTTIARGLFAGIEKADSITLDPHKWLYLPVETGCALVRNPRHLEQAFSLKPDYLRRQASPNEYEPLDWYARTFQFTRDAKAVRVWMTFLAHGADAIREEIDNNIQSMRYLGALLAGAPDFELLAPVALSTVCFRYVPQGYDPEGLDELNRVLLDAVEKDGRVFVPGTRVHGMVSFRACTINHRHTKEHVERLMAVVRELGERVSLAR